MIHPRFILLALLTCSAALCSCSQTNSKTNQPLADVFVGSTPCDSLIRSYMGIPLDIKCDFIKWELSLSDIKKDTGRFQLTANYGVGQNNTNGFIGGGEKISAEGTYKAENLLGNNQNQKLYSLSGRLKTAVFLVQMDNNILHFTDNSGKLLVGNGGWSYILNKIK